MPVHAAASAAFGAAACLAAWAAVSLAVGRLLGPVMPGAGLAGPLVGSVLVVVATHPFRARLCGPRRPHRPWALVYDGWPSLALVALLAGCAMVTGAPDAGPAVAHAALAALAEEMVFRLAMTSVLSPMGPGTACVGSSAAFAAAHAMGAAPALVPIRVCEALAFGLFLSTEVWLGGTTAAAVVYHLAFDLALGLAAGAPLPPWALLLAWGGVTAQLGAVAACRLAELRGAG